jgi:hypothetical protein
MLNLRPPMKAMADMTEAEKDAEGASLDAGTKLLRIEVPGVGLADVLIGAPIPGEANVPVIVVSVPDGTRGTRFSLSTADADAALSQVKTTLPPGDL